MVHRSEHEYQPTANSHLVLPHELGSISLEYIKLLDNITYIPEDEPSRRLRVVSDTVLELHDLLAELHGDALFVFNALAAAREQRQSAAKLWAFGGGFRAHYPSNGSLSTYHSRAVEALDHWAREASGDDLIERNIYGSGPNTVYRLKPDIAIIDERFHNTANEK